SVCPACFARPYRVLQSLRREPRLPLLRLWRSLRHRVWPDILLAARLRQLLRQQRRLRLAAALRLGGILLTGALWRAWRCWSILAAGRADRRAGGGDGRDRGRVRRAP